MGLRYRFASFVLDHRAAAYLVFIAITIFFAFGLPRAELETVYSDLLPADDPFVQVYKDHPNFGSPLSMIVMVKRVDGDIYNPETIQKIWQLTRDIDLAPSVDHAQILSITTEKARYSQANADGIDMRPLMGDIPPSTEQEMQALRERVDKSPSVREFLISRDHSATLISATFIEHSVDWGEAFEYVQALVEAARDEQHEVYLAGQPALIGWVYRYEWEMVGIFAVTIVALILALIFYMRSWVGVLTPIITSTTAAIWAFGFVGWLDIPIEPLLMVVPLLLTARSFSHSVQFTERFYEVYQQKQDRIESAKITMRVMMTPSVLSILTDVLGIVVVVAAPIPAMVKHAIFCGMWAVWLIPTGVVLISLLLATLPPPSRVERMVGTGSTGMHSSLLGLLGRIAAITSGRNKFVTAAVVAVISTAALITAAQIRIGNPVVGTNLLWHDSEFNQAVRGINGLFPGTNTLEIVLEAKDEEAPIWTAHRVDTIATMQALQLKMEHSTAPAKASLSFADYLSEVNRLYNGGDVRWLPLDMRERALSAATVAAMMGSSATNFSNVISDNVQHSTVSFWYDDNKQETVDAVLAAARKAVEEVGVDHELFTVRLGTGTIAIQEAVNNVINRYHHIVVALLNLFIFIIFSLAYRSFMAGVILLIPVNIAHQSMIACMHLLGIGLDVNSMIVAAIGLGVGIDYGIYLLTRMCEEYQHAKEDWQVAVTAALQTTGKAIAFTATIMAVGILPLYFLSGLKFVADMGLLIICIMGINMVTALVVLPLLVSVIKPRFVQRRHSLLSESFDVNTA